VSKDNIATSVQTNTFVSVLFNFRVRCMAFVPLIVDGVLELDASPVSIRSANKKGPLASREANHRSCDVLLVNSSRAAALSAPDSNLGRSLTDHAFLC